MVNIWLLLGFIGWITLMVYRITTEGKPNAPIIGYINGFVFSLILGPICFMFLGYLIYRSKQT